MTPDQDGIANFVVTNDFVKLDLGSIGSVIIPARTIARDGITVTPAGDVGDRDAQVVNGITITFLAGSITMADGTEWTERTNDSTIQRA